MYQLQEELSEGGCLFWRTKIHGSGTGAQLRRCNVLWYDLYFLI